MAGRWPIVESRDRLLDEKNARHEGDFGRNAFFQRLGVVLVIAELFSAGAPTVQAQPIRTYPASVVFQGDVFDCGPAALATLLQLRLRRSATLSELAEALPVLSREEWRRIRTHG